MNPRRRTDRRTDQGQASLELVGLLPLVLLLLVLAFQVVVMAYTAHGASEAARDAARAYSLDQSASAAAEQSLPGAVSLVSVSTFGPHHGVRVVVEAPAVIFLTDRQITRTVTMP